MKGMIAVLLALSLALPSIYAREPQHVRADTLASGCRAAAEILGNTGSDDGPQGQLEAMKFTLGAGNCIGYIRGFIAAHSLMTHRGGAPQYCLPDGVSTEQIARLLVRRLEEHPQFMHSPDMVLVLGVLQGTWPCNSG